MNFRKHKTFRKTNSSAFVHYTYRLKTLFLNKQANCIQFDNPFIGNKIVKKKRDHTKIMLHLLFQTTRHDILLHSLHANSSNNISNIVNYVRYLTTLNIFLPLICLTIIPSRFRIIQTISIASSPTEVLLQIC